MWGIVVEGEPVPKGCRVSALRRLREERHLTQEQLAVAAEVSTSTVYHIEAGKVRPRPAIVRRLARVLHVSPDEIEREMPQRASAEEP
jgi:transcriptional regulator with XRE-family HTH domain